MPSPGWAAGPACRSAAHTPAWHAMPSTAWSAPATMWAAPGFQQGVHEEISESTDDYMDDIAKAGRSMRKIDQRGRLEFPALKGEIRRRRGHQQRRRRDHQQGPQRDQGGHRLHEQLQLLSPPASAGIRPWPRFPSWCISPPTPRNSPGSRTSCSRTPIICSRNGATPNPSARLPARTLDAAHHRHAL